ncbi:MULTISPECIES: sigma-70 family RNA polymerase sigma factor [unclassified Streptomyces]|uniref:sigma-70 family RNA polymerase sigma factor n=1 Tax=unclassified Streptomyces TaxID=2593676 RepID=UPI0036FA71A3
MDLDSPSGPADHTAVTDAVPDAASPYDTALVRAAGAGDRAALEELLSACLPLVHRVVGRALHHRADVDDVAQEVMLRIVRGLPGLREPERFRSWIVAIAYREVQQHHRRHAHDLSSRRLVQEWDEPSADFAERSVAEAVMSDQRHEALRATHWLEPADRQLLALWWEEVAGALSRAELARAVNLSRGHAAVRVQRVKEQLRTCRVLVRALASTPRCQELAAVVQGWDGRPSSVWRKRMARHVRDCPACGALGEGLIPPEHLLPGIAVPAVPAALLAGIGPLLDSASAAGATSTTGALLDRVTEAVRQLRPRAVLAAAVGTAMLLAGLALVIRQEPAPDDMPRSAPSTAATRSATPAPGSTTGAATASASASASISAATSRSTPQGPAPAGTAAVLHVAPDGSDAEGDGSPGRPYATLGKAVGLVRPGQTIALRGGTYRPTGPVTIDTDGTARQPIVLTAYQGERPVIDVSAVPDGQWAVTQRADHWTVRNLEVRGSSSHAWVCSGCAHNVFSGLTMHHNARSGLVLRDAGTEDNTITNSDFHHNRDASGGGSGLAIVFGSGAGNTVRYCRTWENGGDGIDLGGFTSPTVLEGNWSYRNSNGFTFGGGGGRTAVAHVARNNAAWDNEGYGFNDEGNPGALALERNSAYRNGIAGFRITDAAGTLTGNAAWSNPRETDLGPSVRSSSNTWNGAETAVPVTGLRSTDPRTAEGPRRTDGALPASTFLVPRDPRAAVGARMPSAPR